MLASDFDEQDAAVTRMIEQAIVGAHRNGLTCGICGQAPSDRPGFADWLVERNIDSISLSPDSVVGVMQRLSSAGWKGDLEIGESAGRAAGSRMPA